MRSSKNILFQVLFVMTLLIGVGLDMASPILADQTRTELASTTQSNEELSDISESDLFDDDHLCQRFDHIIYADQSSRPVAPSDQSFKTEYSDTSWQPPQFA